MDHSPPTALEKPRLVILGTGFGAFNLLKNIGNEYIVTIVSPRNHFLFTPLLPSTTVGTVEFRSIIEPIRHAKNFKEFFHAAAVSLNLKEACIRCAGISRGDEFDVPYDILVIAVGSVSNTFGVPGVKEHALFLKDLNDARALRQQVIRCFERASLPGLSAEERKRLVHFVICGGGPTGVEFAAELNDFLFEDLREPYPALVAEAKITIVEATDEILSTFDARLRAYALRTFRRSRIQVLTRTYVVRIEEERAMLSDGSILECALLLWSTGNGPAPFVKDLPFSRDSHGRIIVDEFLRVKDSDTVYALGDCATPETIELPATAQVAQQEGKYLGRMLRRKAQGRPVVPFRYRHYGMLAYIGRDRALADLETVKGHGRGTWLFWRSAYLSRLVSLKNKTLVLFDWFKTRVFGRDISQF
jgi:NADH:ubiquinone reductase (non-electrogenic)